MATAIELLSRWRTNPVAFVRDQFKVEPDEWQKDVLMSFADRSHPRKRISLQACAGPGKSALLAWVGWNFLSCWGDRDDHPKGAAVSITSDNLKANLWPEFAKWQAKSPFLTEAFTWTKERIFSNERPATWFLDARSWPKTASPDEQGRTLSGLHSGYVLALIDESGAIPPAVLRAAEQALSTCKFGRIVQAGNPLSREGMLYATATTLADQWDVIRITGDPDDPKRSPRIDIDWARQQIQTYGRENPWVMAYILGKFPPSGLNNLLGPDEVGEAMGRHVNARDYEHAARILGVDVAREGDDASVIFPRQGMYASEPTVLRNADSLQGAGHVARKMTDWGADAVFVDNTGGFGGGWLDQLRVLGHDAIGVHFASKATDVRYANKRAEMWFAMAQWIKEGGAIPPSPELQTELCAVTYSFKGDQFLLEDKTQIKARIGRSVDRADALALTFAHPVAPRQNPLLASTRARKRDYDPYKDI